MHICVRCLQLNPSFTIDVSFKLYCLLHIDFCHLHNILIRHSIVMDENVHEQFIGLNPCPRSPLSPFGPGPPGSPLAPATPGCPLLPRRPGGPAVPFNPDSPTKNN